MAGCTDGGGLLEGMCLGPKTLSGLPCLRLALLPLRILVLVGPDQVEEVPMDIVRMNRSFPPPPPLEAGSGWTGLGLKASFCPFGRPLPSRMSRFADSSESLPRAGAPVLPGSGPRPHRWSTAATRAHAAHHCRGLSSAERALAREFLEKRCLNSRRPSFSQMTVANT